MITEAFRTRYEDRIKNSCDILAFNAKPDLVIQAGSSGYGTILLCLKEKAKKVTRLLYKDIGFPIPTAPDHQGKLYILEDIEITSGEKITIYLLAGRHHYYESGSSYEAAFITRVCVRSGAKYFIFLNAAGGIKNNVVTGDLMFITDGGSIIPSPNIGMLKNGKSHFPNCAELFDKEWYQRAEKVGTQNIKRGAYFALTGPEYESPVVAHSILLGSNYAAVGMSTVPEVYTAKWENPDVKIAAISLITNHHFDRNAKNVSAEEVALAAETNKEKLAHAVWSLVTTAAITPVFVPAPVEM